MRKLPADELNVIRDKDPEVSYNRAYGKGWQEAARDISKLLGHIDALEHEQANSSGSNVAQQIAAIEAGHVQQR